MLLSLRAIMNLRSRRSLAITNPRQLTHYTALACLSDENKHGCYSRDVVWQMVGWVVRKAAADFERK